jgi:hypothetical protein
MTEKAYGGKRDAGFLRALASKTDEKKNAVRTRDEQKYKVRGGSRQEKMSRQIRDDETQKERRPKGRRMWGFSKEDIILHIRR